MGVVKQSVGRLLGRGGRARASNADTEGIGPQGARPGSEDHNWLPVSFPPVTAMGRPGQGPRLAWSQSQRGPPRLSPVMCSSRAKEMSYPSGVGGRSGPEGAIPGRGEASLAPRKPVSLAASVGPTYHLTCVCGEPCGERSETTGLMRIQVQALFLPYWVTFSKSFPT